MLDEKILEFARLLRKGGIGVSFTQIADALSSVALVGLAWEDFYTALRCTLIKEQADKPLFDKLFRLFFLTQGGQNAHDNLHLEEETAGQMQGTPELVQSADGKGMGRGGGASPYLLLVKAVREGNYSMLRRLGEMAVKGLGELERESLPKLDDLVVQAKVAIGWYQAVNRLERIRIQEGIGAVVYAKWMACLDFLDGYIKELLEEIFVKKYGKGALEEIAAAANIREKEFYRLDNLEIQEIRKRITRLARKLASKYTRRYRRAKYGKIDLRRTVRQALITAGTPVRLKYRKKVVSKPEIVLLCDVSGSVALFSEFMLQLVYTIQNRFSAVRSFLFVDLIDEVTDYFKNKDIKEAIEEAFSKARYSYSGFSDYGKVFSIFARRYLSGIPRSCTLIILGDARNNYRSDEKEFLKEIQEHVRKILWFNPQPREQWNKEDSIMRIYSPFCHQVFECGNLRQMEDVIEAIL